MVAGHESEQSRLVVSARELAEWKRLEALKFRFDVGEVSKFIKMYARWRWDIQDVLHKADVPNSEQFLEFLRRAFTELTKFEWGVQSEQECIKHIEEDKDFKRYLQFLPSFCMWYKDAWEWVGSLKKLLENYHLFELKN